MMYIARFGVGEDNYQLWDHVVEDHKALETPGVDLLYMTRRQGHGDTSLIVDVTDCDSLANLVFKVTQLHPEVTSVSTLSMMKPMFFPLPRGTPRLERFTVTIECEASQCNAVYEKLKNIRPTHDNVLTYVACIFREGGRSILISVLSRSLETLGEMISRDIATIKGVKGTDVTRIVKTRKLATTEKWKRTVRYRTLFEFLDSVEYDDKYLNNVIAGV
jgi:DNA-binding Lrp family transcriptional regulator